MEETGVFLNSEDLLLLVSSQQKRSVLLPFFDGAFSATDRNLTYRMYDLLCDKVLKYGRKDGEYELSQDFWKIINGINNSCSVAEFCPDIFISSKFYLYIAEDMTAILAEPAPNRQNTLRLVYTSVDKIIARLIEERLLPPECMGDEAGRESDERFINDLKTLNEEKDIYDLFDEIEMSIKIFKAEQIKKIVVARCNESRAVIVISDERIYAEPYSAVMLIEEIGKK